jgi:hypothetical protein
MVAVAVPEEAGLPEAGAGGDDAAVPGGAGGPALDDGKIVGGEVGDAVGVRGQVVQDIDEWDGKLGGDFGGIDAPGEVGGLGAAVRDDAGDAEACGEDRLGFSCEEFAEDGVQPGVAGAGVALVALHGELPADDGEEGDVGFRAADVSGEDEVRAGCHGGRGGVFLRYRSRW